MVDIVKAAIKTLRFFSLWISINMLEFIRFSIVDDT